MERIHHLHSEQDNERERTDGRETKRHFILLPDENNELPTTQALVLGAWLHPEDHTRPGASLLQHWEGYDQNRR